MASINERLAGVAQAIEELCANLAPVSARLSNSGHLIITVSDGTERDCGNVFGRDVTDVRLNSDNTLTFFMSDGTQHTTGSVKGDDGFAPKINVTQFAGETKIDIRDVDGTKSFTIHNGVVRVDDNMVYPKNILDISNVDTWVQGKRFTSDGSMSSEIQSAEYYAISPYIPVSERTIISSRLLRGTSYGTLTAQIAEYTIGKTFIQVTNTHESGEIEPFDLDDDTGYIRVCINKSILSTTFRPQIEYGTERTDYEVYFAPYSIEESIVCWGDSLTHGSGAGNEDECSYPAILATLTNRTVYKCGFPGDNSAEIAGYAGAMPLIVKPCTIPATGSVDVEIYSYDMYDGYAEGGAAVGKDYPFRFPSICRPHINPVTIDGIEGTLDLSAGTNTATRTFSFTRTRDGEAKTITHAVPLTCHCSKYADSLPIIWIGTNGGWWSDGEQHKDINILISQIRAMVEHKDKFIVIGLSAGIDTTNAAYDKAMLDAFGKHYINPRRYLVDYGFADWNALYPAETEHIPTGTDSDDIEVGRVPSSFRAVVSAGGQDEHIDGTHYSDIGYELLARRIYEHGKFLGYWG